MTFRTMIKQAGKTATGIEVPPEVVAALGPGRRHAVVVTIGDYSFRSTVASMGGVFMIPFSAEHRTASGLAGGDEVEVALAPDTQPRELVVPPDFSAALDADPEGRRFFDSLSYSNRRRFVDSIQGAKTAETRQRRIDKSVSTLHDNQL